MNVVQVVASVVEEAAGPSYSVVRLSETLANGGHHVDLLSLGSRLDERTRTFRRRQLTQDFANLHVLRQLKMSSGMKAVLRSEAEKSDIIHNHGLWLMPNIYAGWAAQRARCPLVISPRGMLSPEALAFSPLRKKMFWHGLQRRSVERSQCLHATSEKERDDIRRQGIEIPVCIIPNGIDIPPTSRAVPSGGRRTLLFLGRLHPVKRVEALLRAWRRIEGRYPGWQLEIAGPGDPSYVIKLKSMVAERSSCTFLGPLFGAQKLEAYRRASLYVLPSASENFGITIAEALAAGTPVITTRGTPWRGLEENRAGWWIGYRDNELSEVLERAMSLEPLALHAMGERGTRWMESSYSWSSVAERMQAVYEWLAKGAVKPGDIDT